MKPTVVPDFQRFQLAFARHLRDPHHTPRPAGVNARRMAVYSELLFNNVCGFLDRCFPVSRQLLGEARWRRLNRSFYRDWPLRSPLHRDICREFAAYLRAVERLPRWLAQLAHYEWAELAVDLMDVATPEHDPDGDLLHRPVALNPACMRLCFDWPVHRIGPSWRPRKPQATQLLIYRESGDAVRFMEINAVTARLLALLAEQPRTGEDACRALALELQSPQPQQIVDHGAALLDQLRRQQVVLGSLR